MPGGGCEGVVEGGCMHAWSGFLRVEFLLKTESGYLRDAEVN